MPLDPQVEKFLQQLAQLQLPPLTSLSPVQARELAAKLQGKPLRSPRVPKVENRTIPGKQEIPIRIYTPEGNRPFPMLVYFHGGGWVLSDLDTADSTCRDLSLGAECVVVSVDYRLAPEHKFPAAVEDAYAATLWVAENAAALNGDVTRIAVAGDSAGGNLAAAVTLMARDRKQPALVYQVLIYPVTRYGFDTESYREYGKGGFGLTKDEMVWFWHHYLDNTEDGQNPLASPLLAENLSQLPPALIIIAEFDVLRDEAEAYATRLQSAGVPVQVLRYEGMIHAFVGVAQVIDRGKDAIADIAKHLQIAFTN